MKKLLLVATVLVGGMAMSQGGINLRIGIGLPLPPLPLLPRPGIVIREPAVICPAPVYVAPPFCPPPVVVPGPPIVYRPSYWHGGPRHWRGHGEWGRDDRRR